jgi:hypothetical protein
LIFGAFYQVAHPGRSAGEKARKIAVKKNHDKENKIVPDG